MGIIVKVYIENNDEEIDIVTLNSEDKKSSSVTITASVIKDYLNKNFNSKNKSGDSPVRSSVEIDKFNLNSNVIQSENVTCSHSGIHETITPAIEFSEKIVDNSKDHEVISENLNSNVPLNDVRDCVRVIGDTNESDVTEQDHILATTADRGPPDKALNNQVPSSDSIVEDTDSFMCIDGGLDDADSSTLGGSRLKNEEFLYNQEMRVDPETGAENVIASLKNVSYEVDDFLNVVNTTPTQHNRNINNSRLSGVPSFWNEFSYSPSMDLEEIEDENELEEYFVIEKIAASRFNEETKVLEFLLKAQKCVARKEPWAPMRTNITDLTISDPKCVYIQCPKGFKSYRRKLQEKFDQCVQFVDMEKSYMYGMPSETMSNSPSIVDITSNEFSSVVPADIIMDPQKSLNDACLTEPYLNDSRNVSPVKLLRKGENINMMTDIGLPSAHFFIADMVPGLGEQLVEFVENKATLSTNPINETETCEKPSNTSSDRPRKKHRNDVKHLQCPQCSYKTVSASALGNHLRHHTKELLKCRFCPKSYLSNKGLRNHEKTHVNGESLLAENVGIGSCDSFGKTIQKRFMDNLKKHVKPALDENSSTNLERSQASVILNEAVTPNFLLFNDGNIKCKIKPNSQNQLKKRSVGRPKKMKSEMKNEPKTLEIIDLCDDVKPSDVPTAILRNAAPIKSEGLQQCLADTVDAIESHELPGSVPETSLNSAASVQERKDTCDVCQRSFKTALELFDHKEEFHKYPIVLLKRLSISY